MSKRQGRPTGPTPKCIFCDGKSGTKLTGEHLWAAWMSPFVPRDVQENHVETWDTFNMNTPLAPTDVRRARGHTTSRKLRRVCFTCNSGWMSRLETAAKPYLLPMMLGHRVSLGRGAQKTVVDWINLKCMVFENNRREDAATTLQQRERFMLNREIPAYTQIHLFCCGEPPWDWQWHRHSATATASPAPESLHPRTKNTQTFAIGIGELLVYVLQAFAADVEFGFKPVAARQIWPPTEDVVNWPPNFRANRAEAEVIAANMAEFIRENL